MKNQPFILEEKDRDKPVKIESHTLTYRKSYDGSNDSMTSCLLLLGEFEEFDEEKFDALAKKLKDEIFKSSTHKRDFIEYRNCFKCAYENSDLLKEPCLTCKTGSNYYPFSKKE